MALAELKFYSEALGMQSSIYVIIPQKSNAGEIGVADAQDGGFKCLLLLHGLSDDNSIWLRRTSIERYASIYNLAVIMPSGGKSFYTDMKHGDAYYKYIAHEVPRIASEFFRLSDKREDWFVAGLSMGGYGAMKIALREHDRFCACAAFSGVLDVKAFCEMPGHSAVMTNVFGENFEIPEEDDLFMLSEKTVKLPDRPRLFIGVGTEDFLYGANAKMREHLEKIGYPFTYRESAGTHSWLFWDEYIQYALEWFFEK